MLNEVAFSNGLALRDASEDDHAFMESLFRSTRKYLYQMDMPKPYVDVLIDQQYQFQMASYRNQFPQASVLIVHYLGDPIGRMILQDSDVAIHIIDLCMVSGMRGKGYGTSILQTLQNLAKKQHKLVWLSVDRQNQRAKRRYLALGFKVADVSDATESMVWSPATMPIHQL